VSENHCGKSFLRNTFKISLLTNIPSTLILFIFTEKCMAKKMESVKVPLVRNPDVVLREEDPDGALLFNPDTNQVLVLNTTGLFIWKHCDGKKDLPAILAAVKNNFEEVPETNVVIEVKDFVTQLQTKGFIGTSGEKK
jgi:hypothetical protein